MPNLNSEPSKPLSFFVVGSGQVVEKYWIPAQKKGKVNIPGVVSLEPEASFRTRVPDFKGEYRQASPDNVIDHLVDLSANFTAHNPNIALLTPAQVRLAQAKAILEDPKLRASRLFLEKPYADNERDLDRFGRLLDAHGQRIHLSGKYANGRAGILLDELPVGIAPLKITARLIEGTDYYNVVRDGLRRNGTHQFLKDGPELDLGFHPLDIITTAALEKWGKPELQIQNVEDLSSVYPSFEPGFGFSAHIGMRTPLGMIPIDLQAGKADMPTERFIELDYGDFKIRQVYTSGNADDPVTRLENGVPTFISQHEPGYNYYSRELQPDVFSKQTPEQQALSLKITQIALAIRNQRLMQAEAAA